MGYPECGQLHHGWRRIGGSSWDTPQDLVGQTPTVTRHVQIGTTFDLDQIVKAHPRMEEDKVVDRSYF
jgi:hypothetical protein